MVSWLFPLISIFFVNTKLYIAVIESCAKRHIPVIPFDSWFHSLLLAILFFYKNAEQNQRNTRRPDLSVVNHTSYVKAYDCSDSYIKAEEL